MDNLNDIKKTWLTAKTDSLPGSAEAVRMIKAYRKRNLLKKTAMVVIALTLTGLLIKLLFSDDMKMLTTHIGEVCMLTAGIILIATNTNSLRSIYQLKNYTNKQFVAYLEQAQAAQIRYYKKTQVIGFSFVSIGLLLFLYEGVYKDPVLCIVLYSLTIIYLLVMWLVVRPRASRRYMNKLNDALKKIETISKQF